MELTSIGDYIVTQYSDKGELIYAICQHGYIVIDKREVFNGN